MELRLTRYGPFGVLVRFATALNEDSLARCRGLVRWIEEHPPEALVDCTPANDAILLEFSEPLAESRLSALGAELKRAVPLPAHESTLHTLPVVYDGPDLGEFGERTGLSVEDVMARHSSVIYSVYVIGFSPGFPYLGPLDARLHLPRRSLPRPHVPPGSVGIGGEHTGIYSIASPGGWWLIGRTATEVFSPAKARGDGHASAFLLRPGDRVRFEPAAS
jgi:KipI family sensor histidine kinase inhibitor